jgi:hypothetical protein
MQEGTKCTRGRRSLDDNGQCTRNYAGSWDRGRSGNLDRNTPYRERNVIRMNRAICPLPFSCRSLPTVTGLRAWPSLKCASQSTYFDLTGIAHVPPVRTLRRFVTQVRHGDDRTILLKQPVNPALPSSAALVAHEAHHLLFGRSLTERIGTVRHRHNQLPRRNALSICAVGLSMSASWLVAAAMSTSSAADGLYANFSLGSGKFASRACIARQGMRNCRSGQFIR